MNKVLFLCIVILTSTCSKFLITKSGEVITPNNLDDTYGTNIQKEMVIYIIYLCQNDLDCFF